MISQKMNVEAQENIGLVHMCAKKFVNKGIEYEDLVQAGCVGLVKATKNFDDGKGTKFSTYAVHVILGEIRQLFRQGGAIKISRALRDTNMKVQIETEKFLASNDRAPSIKELSKILGLSEETITESIESSKIPVSLGAFNEEENREMEIPVPFDEDKINFRISLQVALKTLGKLDRQLIFLRFFKRKTQTETGKILGISQVKVSRREKLIINELKNKMQ